MILVVDDEAPIRQALCRILRQRGYECEDVPDVAQARAALAEDGWELVLCDVMMPGEESGIDLLRHVRATKPTLPIVMVSGVGEPTFATTALEIGAYGYVTKPFEANQVVIAVANALLRGRLEAENAEHRTHLERMVTERTDALRRAIEELRLSEAQLRLSTEDTVRVLSRAIEGRDIETGCHIERMSRYAALLARHHGMTDEECELIRLASPMHDVGKIGVPDGILFKPGPITAGEFEVIKQHSELGFAILAKSEQPLLVTAAAIARTHHERWDGDGYPQGLSGEDIPVEGRIAAVADVFDALVSRRVYKPAFPVERALGIMRDGAGTQFDPELVGLFLEHADEAVAVLEQYPDD